MAFRKSIPMGEMRDKAAAKPGADKHVTDYQPSKGGWYRPAAGKPVPGKPKR